MPGFWLSCRDNLHFLPYTLCESKSTSFTKGNLQKSTHFRPQLRA
uniref:Uncharacterized protein n=1 Tax=Arundo donax TaxID=35708 RepID=A0A0A9EPZ9_ARUDO